MTKLPKYLKYIEAEDLYYYQSHANPYRWYQVIPWDRSKPNSWKCDCPSFWYNDITECKHIKQIKFIDKARLSGLVEVV